MKLKRMGVVNITPNSFSDGGEVSLQNLLQKITSFGQLDALDVGAESTAPMNQSISAEEEWERLAPALPVLTKLSCTLSIDTYHPETIFRIAKDHEGPLIWNDVSGKFDRNAEEFLAMNENFHYIFCHNLAPSRELTGAHMHYLSKAQGEDFLRELAEFFLPRKHPRIIFDPCLGFSKTYEQNWFILNNLPKLLGPVSHSRWLLGFSRKSFLRRKYELVLEERDQLDELHVKEVQKLIPSLSGEVWIRTHRPELL